MKRVASEVQVLRAMSRGKVLCQLPQGMLAWKRGQLGILEEETFTFSPLADFRESIRDKALLASRFVERCFRETPRAAAYFDDRVFVTRNGYLAEINLENGGIRGSIRFREGMRSPLGLTRIEDVDGFDDCLAFGDYWGNKNRDDASINVLRRGSRRWESAAVLPAGSLCHIHSVVPDKENGRVLVLTGDTDAESAIIEFRDNFTEQRVMLAGKQIYRSCVLYPWEDGVLYATDSPLVSNGLYFSKDGYSERLLDLHGSSIFHDELPEGGFVFATTVEPDSRLSGWKLKLSRNPGPGIVDNRVEVCVVDEKGFRVLMSLRKDVWPASLFQFGTVEPVVGKRWIFLNCNALECHDRDVLAVELGDI